MHLGAVGTIETWNADAAAGTIRLEDGLLVAFDRSACGFSHVGGCESGCGYASHGGPTMIEPRS